MFEFMITRQLKSSQKSTLRDQFFSPRQHIHIDPEDVINSGSVRFEPIAQIVNEIPYVIVTIKDKDVRFQCNSVNQMVHFCRYGVPMSFVMDAIGEPRNIRYRGEWEK